MKSSDAVYAQAVRTLARVMARLSPGALTGLIDNPIDRAAESFEWPPAPGSVKDVLPAAARFLQHLSREALSHNQQLSLLYAQDDVIALLDGGGDDPAKGGYAGALLETLGSGPPDWSGLAARITEALKMRLHQRYVRWAIESEIDPAGWDLRCALTAILIERMRAYLPREITEGPPERWAGQLTTLLGMCIGMEGWSAVLENGPG